MLPLNISDNCYPPMPAPPQSHNYNMYSNGGPPCSVHPHNQYYSQPAGYGNQCSMHPMYGGQPQNHYYPHPSSAMNMNNMQNMNNMGNMQNMQNMQTLTYSTINHTQPPPVSLPHSKSLDQYENNIQVCLQCFKKREDINWFVTIFR